MLITSECLEGEEMIKAPIISEGASSEGGEVENLNNLKYITTSKTREKHLRASARE